MHSSCFDRFGFLVVACGLLGIAANLSGCKSSPRAPKLDAGAEQLNRAIALMTGAFASTEQSNRDKEFRDIHLHMQPIWQERSTPTEQWLYVEQATAEQLDAPYRQRVYRVVTGLTTGTIVSEVYELPGGAEGALKFAGAWQTPEAFDTMTHDQLVQRVGCSVELRESSPGVFEGGTNGRDCLSSRGGATYATSRVRMDEQGLETWDQGFDSSGTQVWGAVKGGYEFRRTRQ